MSYVFYDFYVKWLTSSSSSSRSSSSSSFSTSSSSRSSSSSSSSSTTYHKRILDGLTQTNSLRLRVTKGTGPWLWKTYYATRSGAQAGEVPIALNDNFIYLGWKKSSTEWVLEKHAAYPITLSRITYMDWTYPTNPNLNSIEIDGDDNLIVADADIASNRSTIYKYNGFSSSIIDTFVGPYNVSVTSIVRDANDHIVIPEEVTGWGYVLHRFQPGFSSSIKDRVYLWNERGMGGFTFIDGDLWIGYYNTQFDDNYRQRWVQYDGFSSTVKFQYTGANNPTWSPSGDIAYQEISSSSSSSSTSNSSSSTSESSSSRSSSSRSSSSSSSYPVPNQHLISFHRVWHKVYSDYYAVTYIHDGFSSTLALPWGGVIAGGGASWFTMINQDWDCNDGENTKYKHKQRWFMVAGDNLQMKMYHYRRMSFSKTASYSTGDATYYYLPWSIAWAPDSNYSRGAFYNIRYKLLKSDPTWANLYSYDYMQLYPPANDVGSITYSNWSYGTNFNSTFNDAGAPYPALTYYDGCWYSVELNGSDEEFVKRTSWAAGVNSHFQPTYDAGSVKDIAFDHNGNLLAISGGTSGFTVYKHSGFTSTINDTFTIPAITIENKIADIDYTQPQGILWYSSSSVSSSSQSVSSSSSSSSSTFPGRHMFTTTQTEMNYHVPGKEDRIRINLNLTHFDEDEYAVGANYNPNDGRVWLCQQRFGYYVRLYKLYPFTTIYEDYATLYYSGVAAAYAFCLDTSGIVYIYEPYEEKFYKFGNGTASAPTDSFTPTYNSQKIKGVAWDRDADDFIAITEEIGGTTVYRYNGFSSSITNCWVFTSIEDEGRALGYDEVDNDLWIGEYDYIHHLNGFTDSLDKTWDYPGYTARTIDWISVSSSSRSSSSSSSSSISRSASSSSESSSSRSSSSRSSSSLSSSSSSSSSSSLSVSSSSSASVGFELWPGVAYGEQFPNALHSASEWTNCTDENGLALPYYGSQSWGRIYDYLNDECWTPVIDTGAWKSYFQGKLDHYATDGGGTGAHYAYMRGSQTSFSMYDGSPSWEVYYWDQPLRNWRYVQFKIVGAQSGQNIVDDFIVQWSSLSSSSSSSSLSSSSSSSRSSSSSSRSSSSSSRSSSSESSSSRSSSSSSQSISSSSRSSSSSFSSSSTSYNAELTISSPGIVDVAKGGKGKIWDFWVNNIEGGNTIVDLKVSAACSNLEYTGQSDSKGQKVVKEKWIQIKSNGVKGSGIVDDAESEYTPVGGGFNHTANYHKIGNIPGGCSRRIYVEVEYPENISDYEIVIPRLVFDYGVSISSSSSSSMSISISASLSSSSSSKAEVYGWHFGAQPPVPYIPASWEGWEVEWTSQKVRVTDYSGLTLYFDDMILGKGDSFVSPVRDTGDTGQKWFEVFSNVYDTGSGMFNIYIRGQASAFESDDITPTWVRYRGRTGNTWRFIQMRVRESLSSSSSSSTSSSSWSSFSSSSSSRSSSSVSRSSSSTSESSSSRSSSSSSTSSSSASVYIFIADLTLKVDVSSSSSSSSSP